MSMALSFYTYWQNHDTLCSSLFPPPSPSPSPELLTFHEDSTFYDTNSLNLFFDPNYTNNLDIIPGLQSSNYSDILPPITPTGNVVTPSPQFQVSSFTCQQPYYNLPNYNSATFNHDHLLPVDYYPMGASELPPLPDAYQGDGFTATTLPPWYGYECGVGRNIHDQVVEEKVKKQNNGGRSLSAQSLAARVRRRKISDKTQELGRLIPGGHKMNTAEMFQAAFKYIKLLQAQIAVLKFMAPLPESEEVLGNGELQALVTCTLIQEKLYSSEKCIVPTYFAETAGDQTHD